MPAQLSHVLQAHRQCLLKVPLHGSGECCMLCLGKRQLLLLGLKLRCQRSVSFGHFATVSYLSFTRSLLGCDLLQRSSRTSCH